MGRMIVAALVAGVAMFFWGFVSHAVLGIAEKGIKSIPDESAVVAALNSGVREHGLYRFPAMPEHGDKAAEEAWEKKFESGPHGLIVYCAPSQTMAPKQFVVQYVSCVAAALVAAILLAMASMRFFVARFFFVTLLGAFAALVTDIPYWNWDGYPDHFTIGCVINDVATAAAAALVLAAMLKPADR